MRDYKLHAYLIPFGMIDIDTLLAWGAAYKKVGVNENIFQEGSHANFYYQVVSGRIRWINVNDDGSEFLQALISENECFGELPLFDGEPYAATAIADVESVIIRLDKASFLQILKESPELHMSFSKLLATRVRFKFMLIKEMAQHCPEHSISALLNYFKGHNTNVCSKCNRVNLTRQQIADMTGLRVETVIRAIRNMHVKGQLSIQKGKVYC